MTISDSLLERVRKLLAQAEDPAATVAEAEAFNAKAAELIARYGIQAAMLANTGASPEAITQRGIVIHNPYRRDKAQLLFCIADPLRCRTVHYRNRVEIFGYTSDIERVEILFTSLLLQATNQLVHIRPDNYYATESTSAYRRSWLSGFASAVHLRLTRAEQHAASQHETARTSGMSTDLVLADRATQVEQAFNQAYPRLRTLPARRLSGSGRHDGYAAGTRANLATTALHNRRTALGR